MGRFNLFCWIFRELNFYSRNISIFINRRHISLVGLCVLTNHFYNIPWAVFYFSSLHFLWQTKKETKILFFLVLFQSYEMSFIFNLIRIILASGKRILRRSGNRTDNQQYGASTTEAVGKHQRTSYLLKKPTHIHSVSEFPF